MKKFIILMLAGTLATGLAAPAAFAAGTSTSDATITFTEDGSATKPKDPDDPDKESGDDGTEMAGPLSIDYVPDLDFGEYVLNGKNQTYNATTMKPYIQVSDKRGTGAGWKVSAKLSHFTTAGTTEGSQGNSFPGVLTFRNPTTVSTTGNNSKPPVTETSITLASGDTEKKLVGTENPGDGMGSWLTRWYPKNETTSNDSLTLTLNTSNAYADSYKASVTWILSDAP